MDQHKKSRIVWLTPGQGFSRIGRVRYTLPLLQEFQRVYPNVIFITTGDIDPEYRKILNIYSRGRFSLKILRSTNSSRYYGRGLLQLSPIIVLDLLRFRPQVVISQELNLWTILAALVKFIGGWKLIVLWTGSSPGVDLVDDPLRSSIRRLITKYIDAFITNSIRGKNYLQDYLYAHNDRVFRAVYKPPDPKSLLKIPYSHPIMPESQRPRFLYVGQLIPRKGINYLLSAWLKLQDISSGHGSLMIIGSGSQRDELVQQVNEMGLKNVYFIGEVEYPSLGTWYESSDIFVFPTLEDNWGSVVLEAMAFGKPIICSKYAGSSELVCHGGSGFLFDPEDTDELAQLMLQFVNSPQLIEQFGQNAKEIMKPYTIINSVASIHNVIHSLLKGGIR